MSLLVNALFCPPTFCSGESNSGIHRVSGSGGSATETLMYTDGLSAFTLFFEHSNEAELLPPMTRKGPTVAISRKINVGTQFVLATIVGELPEVAAQQILNSIQRVVKE